jgi:hypothetical protein
MIAWKNVVSQLPSRSRRRVITTVLVYALSATIRLTTATGDEAKILAQAAQRTNPATFIKIGDGDQIFGSRTRSATYLSPRRSAEPQRRPGGMCATPAALR